MKTMKLCWMSEFSCEKYHKKYIFKHYLKFSISNSINLPWGSKRYALNTVARLFKGSLAHWSSHKTGSWAPNAGSFLIFLLPALHCESSLGGLYRDFPKINKSSLFGFSWLLPSSGPGPIGNGLGSAPDLVGYWVTGSLLARKKVIASNRSVGFLLLIQPTASSRHFDRQSNSFTPLLTVALHQDEANVDLL